MSGDPGCDFFRGMSLRAWYAGLAMQGSLAAGERWDSYGQMAAYCDSFAMALIERISTPGPRSMTRPKRQTPGEEHLGRICWIEQLPLGVPPRAVAVGDDGRFRYYDESTARWMLITAGVMPISLRPV